MDLDQPTKNFPLLWKVYDHIEAHPEEWNQKMWISRQQAVSPETTACGTKFCFAGHAVMIARPDALPLFASNDVNHTGYVTIDGGAADVELLAREILGLTADEGYQLFDASNELHEIHTMLLQLERNDQAAWLAEHASNVDN